MSYRNHDVVFKNLTMTPRTLQQSAFGPYAEWHVDRRTWLGRLSKPAALVCLVVVGVLLWGLNA